MEPGTRGSGTKNVVLGVVAVVIFGVAAFLYFYPWETAPELPKQFTVHGVCLDTQKEFTVTVPLGEAAPYPNPETGRRTVYPWYFCLECRHRFVSLPPSATAPAAVPTTGPQRMPGMVVCPLCSSAATGAWQPLDPDEAKPAGDAPLPPLPPPPG